MNGVSDYDSIISRTFLPEIAGGAIEPKQLLQQFFDNFSAGRPYA